MPSTLYQLLRYARSSKAEAVENFTTEALAAAIRHDATPFVILLREHQLLRRPEPPLEVSVETQVHVRDAGFIDLVTEVRGDSWTEELWLEVKVDAPESGQQLTNYERWIGRLETDAQPVLAVLSKMPLAGHSDTPWISWQSLRQAARHATATSTYWGELTQFLKEIGMADEYDEPIVARETASLLDAHALYRKATRIIQLAVGHGSSRWPYLGWPKAASDADTQLLWQFRERRRIALPVRTATPAQLYFGIVQTDDSAGFDYLEPHLAVWIDHSPKQTDVRRNLLDRADRGRLPDSWTRRVQGWWALTAHDRLAAFADHQAACDWIIHRIEELDSAGVLNLLRAPTKSEIDIGAADGDGT